MLSFTCWMIALSRSPTPSLALASEHFQAPQALQQSAWKCIPSGYFPILDGGAPAIHVQRNPMDKIRLRTGQVDRRLSNLPRLGWPSSGQGPG